MSDRIIRASEIGQYLYCAKAWYLGAIQGVKPTNVRELEAAIRAYIQHRNHDPRPFVWTASVKTILAKVRKANEALESLH